MPSIYSRMFKKFKDRRYRDTFLASQIRRMIPKQVRAIREAQEMTQQELADAAGTTQTVISRIEKGSGSGNLTIKSLLNLASALDVALVIRFEPIDRFIDWTEHLSSEDIAPRQSQTILTEMEQEATRVEATDAPSWATNLKREQHRTNPPTLEGRPEARRRSDLAHEIGHETRLAPLSRKSA
jgi:transcriptional regulator with XRE-family HTH domain